jgi:hypothetical protein
LRASRRRRVTETFREFGTACYEGTSVSQAEGGFYHDDGRLRKTKTVFAVRETHEQVGLASGNSATVVPCFGQTGHLAKCAVFNACLRARAPLNEKPNQEFGFFMKI